MMDSRSVRPRKDPWTAAIYTSPSDQAPLGGGVVVDDFRVLTCRHLVDRTADLADLWVAFPKAGVASTVRRRVVEVRVAPAADLAILVLAEPAPPEATPAPMLLPEAADLVDETWWAFGFPKDAPYGSDAHGTVGAALSYGWVRLETESRYVVKKGFSGTGIWSPRYEAVVGLIGQAQQGGDWSGDALALTLHQAARELPDEELASLAGWTVAAAGESALAAWGWSLELDEEAGRHWRPRARGVTTDSEAGYRFRGRRAALMTVASWLDRPSPDPRALVVTGSPGVGKSAVLGRVVTTADEGIRAVLPAGDHNVKATVGSVACAVHVKGKTALDVAVEIARAASVRLPREVSELVGSVHRRLSATVSERFNLVIDALDEASSPTDARTILEQIVVPLVQHCSSVGAQVVVGTRRVDDGGHLLPLLGNAVVVDLDSAEYFAEEDLIQYALATLQLVGAERVGNPYVNDSLGQPVAARIAQLAQRNFLVAGLVARRHGLYDTTPVLVSDLAFPPDVGAALDAYLRRLPPVGSTPAALVLTALAYAQSPGLTLDLWQVVLRGLHVSVQAADLAGFTASSAANFLIESSSEGSLRQYRLFHQALNEVLTHARAQVGQALADQRGITDALVAKGRRDGWASADPYLLRSLPHHAGRAGRLDELLTDPTYALHADLTRLVPLADRARTAEGRLRGRLLQLTPRAVRADPSERAAMFSITATLEGVGTAITVGHAPPYWGRWAHVSGRSEKAVLEGHAAAVLAVCVVTVDDRPMLASAGADQAVRIWDPASGQLLRTLLGHVGPVTSVCALDVHGRSEIATGGEDATLRFWDPATGQSLRIADANTTSITAMCALHLGGRALIATGHEDGALQLWNPAIGQRIRTLTGHVSKITAVCAFTRHGRTLITTSGEDGTVRLWDPTAGQEVRVLAAESAPVSAVSAFAVAGESVLATSHRSAVALRYQENGQVIRTFDRHTGTVTTLCSFVAEGKVQLASADTDGTIHLWDPVTAERRRTLTSGAGPVHVLCTVMSEGRPMLVSAGRDGTVRLWDPAVGDGLRPLARHASPELAVCSFVVDKRTLVATAGDDGVIRLWGSATGQLLRVFTGHRGPVRALCAITVAGRAMLVSAGDDDTLRIWDPATGARVHVLSERTDAICSVTIRGQAWLATAHDDSTVRLRSPTTGRRRRNLRRWIRARTGSQRQPGEATAICAVVIDGQTLLAVAGNDACVRIHDPNTGLQRSSLAGHPATVRAVCPLTIDGRTHMATGGDDGAVRVWDPATGQLLQTLTGHSGPVRALCRTTEGNEALLASAGDDRTLRVWSPATGQLLHTISVHHRATGCVAASDLLVVSLDAGVIALKITN